SAHYRFVCSSGGESISPCTTSQTIGPGASSSVTFTITNNGIEAEFFSLSCSKSGAVASCSVPSSLSVPRFQSRDFTLSYTAASSGSSGSITVTASGNKVLTGSVSVTIAQP